MNIVLAVFTLKQGRDACCAVLMETCGSSLPGNMLSIVVNAVYNIRQRMKNHRCAVFLGNLLSVEEFKSFYNLDVHVTSNKR